MAEAGSSKIRTILIVEDEALIAMNQAVVLEKHGYSVRSVYSGEQAIEAAGGTGIDLILMDIDLGRGKMDGTEAAEIILKNHDIPVVFLSSHTEPEIVEKTEKITSFGYVVKDSGETVLIASIKMAFRLHEAYRERLEKSSQLDTLLGNAEDLIGRLDRNKTHLYVNQALCDVMGIPCREYVGKRIEDLGGPPELTQKWNDALDRVFKTGKPAKLEFTLPTAEGEIVLDCKIVPELVEDGEVKTVVAISRDITERKKTEKKFRSLVQNTIDWVWQVDTEGRYTYIGSNIEHIIGYTPEELIGHTPFDLMEDGERQRVLSIFSRIAEKKDKIIGLEDTMIHKEGYPVVFETNAAPLFNEKGDFEGYFGTCRDITERKKMEQELQNVLNSISDGMAVIDRDFNILRTNKALLEDIGAEVSSELIGGKCYAAFYGLDTLCEWCPAKEVFRTGKEQSTTVPFPAENPVRWFDLKASPVRNIRGEVIQVVEVARDITKQKKIEEALKSSEKQKDVILNATAEMVAYYDTSLRIIWANRAGAESVGRSPEDLVGLHCFEVWHNRSEPCEGCPVLKVLETKKPEQAEQRTPDGRFWFLRGYPVFDENGNVSNLVEFGQDITESKKAEKKLKESEEFRGRIIQSLASGLYIYNVKEGRNDYISEQYTNLTGWSLEEINGMGEDFNELFHPDDLPRVSAHFTEMAEAADGEVLEVEYRFRRKGGEWIWCVSRDTVFERDENGAVLRFIGSFFDITERKRAELERSLHEEQLEALIKLNEMDSTNHDELAEFALEASVRLTKSEIGFINFLSKDEKYVTKAIYTQDTLKQCKLPENVSAFEISGCGLWSEAYRQRRPVIVNDYKMPHPSKVGFPEGHPVLRRFISIPIFEGKRIAAVAALGNKETEYTKQDVRELRLFIEGFEHIMQRRNMEEQLRSALSEKDSFMAELNHRVKNNLAIISSLINLKNSALGNSVDLSDIKHQIDAVRIVHDKLYKSVDVTHVELRDYLQDLLATVFSSFSAMTVEIVNRVENIKVPTKRAVPIGLITNEIATNAIKYGFTGDEDARFTVELSLNQDEGQSVLVLSNTGNPFPEDIDLDSQETLGLRLISALVNQLDGTIELQRKPNPRFTIRFPA